MAQLPAAARVLDLADPAARALVAGDAAAGGDPPFDVVVSVGSLVAFADLAGTVARLVALLAPSGELHFVEPVGRPERWSLVTATAGAHLRSVRGLHVSRDVPLAVRAGGLVITDIERFAMPTSVWPLRHFVHGRARRIGAVAS
jgi:hypothetical protein